MDTNKVDLFLISNSKNFDSNQLMVLRDQIKDLDDSRWPVLQSMHFKDPVISLIISLFFGQLGIDRFLIGDVGLGVIKLLTCGGLGIWYIIDIFLIMGATKEKNFEAASQMIATL